MAVQTVITVTHGSETQGTIKPKFTKAASLPHEQCRELSNFFDAISIGQRAASFTTQVNSNDAVAAKGTNVLSGHCSTSDTFLINGVTFTCVASGATNAQFNVGTTSLNQATSLAAAINACTTALVTGVVSATVVGSPAATVTITALATGLSGNWVTIAKGTDVASAQTVSGARLTTGAAPTSITNGGTYHAGV